MEYKCFYRAKTRINSRFFEITHTDDPRCTMPWTVCYCGADYHFRDLYGALCYAYGRGFIERREINTIESNVLAAMAAEGTSNEGET